MMVRMLASALTCALLAAPLGGCTNRSGQLPTEQVTAKDDPKIGPANPPPPIPLPKK
ncbi:MAG TPA: hypothetical protein VE988_12470 [Gemmataceae bacterium]|nr:hypothetical protein [Gemmataceae bacterium]